MDDGAGRRLPEPVAHLLVIVLDLLGLDHMSVIAQPVEQLRTVGLRVDRLQFDALDKGLLARAVGLGLDVQAARAFPHPGTGKDLAKSWR